MEQNNWFHLRIIEKIGIMYSRDIQGVSQRMQQSERLLDHLEVHLMKASWWQNDTEI